MQQRRGATGAWASRGDVEGSQESASDVESRDFPSPLRGKEAFCGPPSTASEREETLRSWDASASAASAASAASDAEERRTGDDTDYDGGDDAESTTAGSTASGSREDWLQSALSGMERYNPAHIEPLEELLQRQSEGEEPYNADANLALLSLYQLNPRRFDAAHARLALLLAMARLPQPDFALCKCLLPGDRMDSAPLADIVQLAEMLETCAFAEFWERVRAQPDLVSGVAGLQGAVRDFVAHVVGSAYQRLGLKHLNSLLGGLGEEELRQWLHEREWKVEMPDDGDADATSQAMVFVSNQEQVVKNRRIVESVDLETIERLLARMVD